MIRSSSRLRSLERGLKKPSRARAKARALTVMRLEGATGYATAHHTPAKLSKDLEDQIAIVRGRAAGKPSRGLLQLENRLLRQSEVEPAGSQIQRHQHAAPTPPPNFVASEPQAQALGMASPLEDGAFSGHFTVESFEDSSSTPALVSPVTSATQNPITPSQVIQAPTYTPEPAVSPPALPWASEQSRKENRARVLSAEQQAVADGFQRDLAAMLGTEAAPAAAPEDTQWNETLRNVGGPPAAVPASTTARTAVVPDEPPAPRSNAHDIFNQMGMAMNYANSFDLGAMDLAARFDQFDSELARETGKPSATPKPPSAPVQALALDEFDLVADLAEISSAQTAPPAPSPTPTVESAPIDVPPANEQAATPDQTTHERMQP